MSNIQRNRDPRQGQIQVAQGPDPQTPPPHKLTNLASQTEKLLVAVGLDPSHIAVRPESPLPTTLLGAEKHHKDGTVARAAPSPTPVPLQEPFPARHIPRTGCPSNCSVGGGVHPAFRLNLALWSGRPPPSAQVRPVRTPPPPQPLVPSQHHAPWIRRTYHKDHARAIKGAARPCSPRIRAESQLNVLPPQMGRMEINVSEAGGQGHAAYVTLRASGVASRHALPQARGTLQASRAASDWVHIGQGAHFVVPASDARLQYVNLNLAAVAYACSVRRA